MIPARAALAALLLAAGAAPAWAASDDDTASSAAATRPERSVAAANAFLATHDEAQRKAVLFPFNDAAQRQRWSNFPDPFAQRSGVRWGDLAVRQRAALAILLGTILSPAGMRMVHEQMDADDVNRDAPYNQPGAHHPGGPGGPDGKGPPPGGPGGPNGGPPPGMAGMPPGGPGGAGGPPPDAHFGSAYYYVSFVGTPSATKPWMLQFGGHHLAINATMVGPRITLSPTLTGGEPLKYDKDGKHIYVVEKEVTAAAALLDSLTPDQRTKAVIATRKIDLVLGPGQDGKVLQPEGLAGKAMTDDQKDLLLALIEARLGMLDADALAPQLAKIRADIDKVFFAWFGPDMPLGEAYFRVTGPSVLIEYAPQDMDGDATDHAHNMYRDPTNEYGAAWTSLK